LIFLGKAMQQNYCFVDDDKQNPRYPIILKTAVEYIPANKNQHKLDKENCVM